MGSCCGTGNGSVSEVPSRHSASGEFGGGNRAGDGGVRTANPQAPAAAPPIADHEKRLQERDRLEQVRREQVLLGLNSKKETTVPKPAIPAEASSPGVSANGPPLAQPDRALETAPQKKSHGVSKSADEFSDVSNENSPSHTAAPPVNEQDVTKSTQRTALSTSNSPMAAEDESAFHVVHTPLLETSATPERGGPLQTPHDDPRGPSTAQVEEAPPSPQNDTENRAGVLPADDDRLLQRVPPPPPPPPTGDSLSATQRVQQEAITEAFAAAQNAYKEMEVENEKENPLADIILRQQKKVAASDGDSAEPRSRVEVVVDDDIRLDATQKKGLHSGDLVFKILRHDEWDEFQKIGVLNGSALDIKDGFIHLSTADQVRDTAMRYFAGETQLILVACSTEELSVPTIVEKIDLDGKRRKTTEVALRWEPSRTGPLYPHLYRSLRLKEDVVWHRSCSSAMDVTPTQRSEVILSDSQSDEEVVEKDGNMDGDVKARHPCEISLTNTSDAEKDGVLSGQHESSERPFDRESESSMRAYVEGPHTLDKKTSLKDNDDLPQPIVTQTIKPVYLDGPADGISAEVDGNDSGAPVLMSTAMQEKEDNANVAAPRRPPPPVPSPENGADQDIEDSPKDLLSPPVQEASSAVMPPTPPSEWM